MKMEPGHTGGATFRDLSGANAGFSREIDCEIQIGDLALAAYELRGRVFLKIDVEGYEINVLRGLSKTLTKVDHAILEVSPQWLGREGVQELIDIMHGAGLEACSLERSGTIGRQLRPNDITAQLNVLFVRKPFRLAAFGQPQKRSQC